MKKIFLLVTLFGFHCQLLALETMYVNSRTAGLYESAGFQSPLLTTLKQNTELVVLERKGIWTRVENSGRTGWTSKYLLKPDKQLEQKVSILARLKSFFNYGHNRKRLTLISTAGGIRGLSDYDSESPTSKNFVAVESMESLVISDKDLEAFLAGSES